MFLPDKVLFCIDALEKAGFKAYAVGGCVRDAALGLTPHDYDLCTNARPEDISRVFADHPQSHNGEKHGTVGVILDHTMYEITTFRTEGSYTDNRHPDWVAFVADIKEDLARRDFTVNAMAYNPKEGYIDPWGGLEDLRNKTLRAVGDPTRRFSEDALRILRGVRFSVRFDLTPTDSTLRAMFSMTSRMDDLARERVFDELCKLLPLINADQLVRFAPILTQVIPELAPCVGFLQHNPHHIHDVYTHTAHVVAQTPPVLALRWAALLHDLGKPQTFSLDEKGVGHFYGHGQKSAALADSILRRLKAPTALRERVVFLVDKHMMPPEPDKRLLLRRLGKYGPEAMSQLLDLQAADGGDAAAIARSRELIAALLEEGSCLRVKDLALTGSDLIALGFTPGPQIGKLLSALLDKVQSETLPNTTEALLQEAKKYKLNFERDLP